MKDYKRLTEKDSCYYDDMGRIDDLGGADILYNQLAELEDKIESGELCDRRETAAEILKSMLNKMYKLTGCGVPYHVKKFIEEIAMEYGVEPLGNSDKLEDEE